MKKVKAMACVLAVAMIAGIFAGCSKTTTISTDKFSKACEKLKLEEFDVDDDAPDMDDIEDGFYAVADEDMVEDKIANVEKMLKDVKLDEAIDVDDIESFAMAAKCIGLDDAQDVVKDPEDLADLQIDGAFAFQVQLKNDKCAKDVMDAIEEMLDDADIDVKDLSNKEYYASKTEGYLRFHVDIAKLVKIIMDNDDIMELVEKYADQMDVDAEEILGSLKGDVAFTVEINGKNIFILAGGALNTKPTVLNSFASAFGASVNPVKVPMNEKFVTDLVDDSIDTILSKLH